MNPPHADPLRRGSERQSSRRCAVLLACIGVALVLGVVARSAAGPAPSFAAAKSYRTGDGTDSIAIADLNGDGKPDLATANIDAGTVSVLLNRGDGSFEPKRDYATGKDPYSLAIADLNGDGKPDLATANIDASTVSVLLNRGDGSFEPKRDYATGPVEIGDDLAIADLNGGGKPDIVTGNDGSVSVLLNRGDGSFRAHHDYRTCRFCFPGSKTPAVVSVAIADVNHDGKLDVATRNIDQLPHEVFGGSVSVFLNKGGGAFKAQRSYRTGPPDEEISGSIALADLNRNGAPDLLTQVIVSANAAERSHLLVLLNKGNGSFGPRLEYRIENGAYLTTVADLNADGKLDVVAPDSGGGRVWVLLNKPGLCDVQYVKDMTLAAARRQLTRANCRVGRVSRAYSKVKVGRVISQKPAFGAVRPGGAKVNLVVSRGRKH